MRTLKEILGREEERLNLRNVGFCVLTVLALITVAFGIAHIKPLFQGTPDDTRVESVARETQSVR